MGKNYWCDFCQRSFVDILETRKKHIRSIQHQRLRKLHYDSFKDQQVYCRKNQQDIHVKGFFKQVSVTLVTFVSILIQISKI